MTISLERLADGTVSDRNFQKLMRLVPDTGGQTVGVRFGSGTATWTASVTSAAVVVPHGLGRAPVFAVAATQNALNGYAVAVGATNLTVTGFRTDNTAVTGSASFYWLVIG